MPASLRQTPASPTSEECAAELIEVLPGVMNAMRQAMRGHVGDALSVPQFRCLAFINRHGASSVTEVAAFLGVTKPTASVMVDRLAKAGAVLIVTDSQDRRRAQLHITDAGKTQMREIRRGARQDFSQLLAAQSPQELAELMAGLAVLRRTFHRN